MPTTIPTRGALRSTAWSACFVAAQGLGAQSVTATARVELMGVLVVHSVSAPLDVARGNGPVDVLTRIVTDANVGYSLHARGPGSVGGSAVMRATPLRAFNGLPRTSRSW